MYFANPWGLLGLLALPVIAYIHLFQRRYPPLFVAGLHLWAPRTIQQMPGRKRERLPITSSLLLELLAALLISLVLADPRFGEWDRVEHLVVILDHSASMQAKPSNGNSFRDAAIQELERRFDGLNRRSVVTLIRTGSPPVTLTRRANLEEARETLKNWRPIAPAHRFAPAWEELGQQLVAESGSLLFITDQLPESKELPGNLEVVSVGQRLENVAINAARWTFDPATSQGEVYIRVMNHSAVAAKLAVVGKKQTTEIFRQSLNLKAGEAQALQVPVKGGLGQLTVRLEKENDGLELDNVVELIEPKTRPVHVAVTLPEGIARDQIQRVLKIMADVSLTAAAKADLVISPAAQIPIDSQRAWWLGMGPVDNSETARKKAQNLIGPYLSDRQHYLTQGVSLGGIVWGGAQSVSQPVIPIISAGAIPLLGQLRGVDFVGYVMNVDLERSNLAESPDWPVLISNLLEARRLALPGLTRWNYRLGEVVRFRLFEGEDPEPAVPLTRVQGTATRKLSRESFVEFSDLSEPGVYEMRLGDRVWDRFAVNFIDPAESDLMTLFGGHHSPKAQERDKNLFHLDQPYTWAMWLGLLAIIATLLADWRVLQPRSLSG